MQSVPRMSRKILTSAVVTTAAVAGAVTVGAQPAAAQAVPCVQRVAVINNGAYSMSFTVATRVGITSTPTDTYNINNFRVIDLTSTPITEGDDVRPIVSATAGDTTPSERFVSFCANGQTATFVATGTTMNISVTLLT